MGGICNLNSVTILPMGKIKSKLLFIVIIICLLPLYILLAKFFIMICLWNRKVQLFKLQSPTPLKTEMLFFSAFILFYETSADGRIRDIKGVKVPLCPVMIQSFPCVSQQSTLSTWFLTSKCHAEFPLSFLK